MPTVLLYQYFFEGGGQQPPPAPSSWDKGFNFRHTQGFVTDGPDETYVVYGQHLYPQTRNDVTFGYDSGDPQTENHNAALDRRLAGNHQQANSGAQDRFRVDLPAADLYDIQLAAGDAFFAQSEQHLEILDDLTSRIVLPMTTQTPAGQYRDVTGVLRTSSTDWVNNNAPERVSFASTILRIRIGRPSGGLSSSCLNHLRVTRVVTVGGGTPGTSSPGRAMLPWEDGLTTTGVTL